MNMMTHSNNSNNFTKMETKLSLMLSFALSPICIPLCHLFGPIAHACTHPVDQNRLLWMLPRAGTATCMGREISCYSQLMYICKQWTLNSMSIPLIYLRIGIGIFMYSRIMGSWATTQTFWVGICFT